MSPLEGSIDQELAEAVREHYNRPDSTNVLRCGDEFYLEVLGDRIGILEDEFSTGMECLTCNGKGYTDEPCDNCEGSGVDRFQQKCKYCDISITTRDSVSSGMRIPLGKKTCLSCKGKGTKEGGIIVPEESQNRPTTGIIKTTGPLVKHLKLEDHVMYSNFTGFAIAFKQKVTIRIMHEHEIMAKIYGQGKLGKVVR